MTYFVGTSDQSHEDGHRHDENDVSALEPAATVAWKYMEQRVQTDRQTNTGMVRMMCPLWNQPRP